MWLDTLTKNNISNTGIQKRDNRLTEEMILYPFFFIAAVIAISTVGYLFYFNQSQHSKQVAHLEKLLNQAREEIRADTACAWGIKR